MGHYDSSYDADRYSTEEIKIRKKQDELRKRCERILTGALSGHGRELNTADAEAVDLMVEAITELLFTKALWIMRGED